MKVVIVALVLGAIALGGGASAYFFFARPPQPAPATAKASAGRGARDTAKGKDAPRGKAPAEDAATKDKTAGASAPDKAVAAVPAPPGPVAGPAPAAARTNGGSLAAGAAMEERAAVVPGGGNAPRTPATARDPKVSDEIQRLARLYEGMRPKEAATVLARLDPELLTTILVTMRERQASKILGLLPAQKAADVTARIARSTPRKDPPVGARAARGGPTS